MNKKVLLCFGENLEKDLSFKNFTDKANEAGLEVHLFDNVVDLQLQPHGIFNILEHVWKDDIEQNDYYFLSNIKEFFYLSYRVLQNTFKEFIFWENSSDKKSDLDFDEIYGVLLNKEVTEMENIHKAIFSNNESYFSSLSLGARVKPLDDFFSYLKSQTGDIEQQQMLYCYLGQCYMLEPSSGKVVYVYLDDQTIDNVKFSDFIIPFDIDAKIIQHAEELFELIGRDIETIMKRQEVLHKVFMFIRATLLTVGVKEQKYYNSLLLAMGSSYGVYAEIFCLSFLLNVFPRKIFYSKLLELCLKTNQINVQNKYFIFTQAKYIDIVDRRRFELELLELETKLFQQICEGFAQVSEKNLEKLDVSKLDADSILIFTSQFLNESHLPTLLTLKLAECLMIDFNKKVWIINTCELLTQVGKVPFFDVTGAKVFSEYSNGNNITYKEHKIPFIQMISTMPSIGGIDGITEFVEDAKPAMIVNISGLSVISEICARFIPTVSINVFDDSVSLPIGNCIITSKVSTEIEAFYNNNGTQLLGVSSDSYKIGNNIDDEEAFENLFNEIVSNLINQKISK